MNSTINIPLAFYLPQCRNGIISKKFKWERRRTNGNMCFAKSSHRAFPCHIVCRTLFINGIQWFIKRGIQDKIIIINRKKWVRSHYYQYYSYLNHEPQRIHYFNFANVLTDSSCHIRCAVNCSSINWS